MCPVQTLRHRTHRIHPERCLHNRMHLQECPFHHTPRTRQPSNNCRRPRRPEHCSCTQAKSVHPSSPVRHNRILRHGSRTLPASINRHRRVASLGCHFHRKHHIRQHKCMSRRQWLLPSKFTQSIVNAASAQMNSQSRPSNRWLSALVSACPTGWCNLHTILFRMFRRQWSPLGCSCTPAAQCTRK